MEGLVMAYIAVNKSNRVGTLFYPDGKAESVNAQSRVPVASLPEYWTNNIRVVEDKEQQRKPKKALEEVVNG
jgi:cytochrome c peroxidase